MAHLATIRALALRRLLLFPCGCRCWSVTVRRHGRASVGVGLGLDAALILLALLTAGLVGLELGDSFLDPSIMLAAKQRGDDCEHAVSSSVHHAQHCLMVPRLQD